MLKKLKSTLKRNRKVYLALSPLFGLYRNGMMKWARLCRGIDQNKVVFCAFDGRSYNDNPRYVSEELHRQRPETQIIWLFKNVEKARRQFDIPDYVTCCNAISREGVSHMATARVNVDNFNKRAYIRMKYPDQVYINTWHGDRAFKKIGYDNPGKNKYPNEENCSLFLTGSDYGDMQCRSAFHYKGEILKKGYPRNDILLRNDPDEAAAIRAKLGISEDTGVLMYAPTFREADQMADRKQVVGLDMSRVLDALEEASGKDWVCLVRCHYMSHGIDLSTDAKRFIDANQYPEMAELLKISDALITDYSSCAGDFALTRRPIWLFQPDLQDYSTNERALYIKMEDTPYWIAETTDEMVHLIRTTTPEAARENCDAILRFYGEVETGHAAEACVEYIIDKLGTGNKPCGKRNEVKR